MLARPLVRTIHTADSFGRRRRHAGGDRRHDRCPVKLLKEVLNGKTPQTMIDWKSDVDPSPETLRHYCDQVCAYLDVTGAERGLIVALTSGTVTPVMPTSSAKA